MSTQKTTLSTSLRTILLVIGVILAAILLWNSSDLFAESTRFPANLITPNSLTESLESEAKTVEKILSKTEAISNFILSLRK